ncbi:MAG: VWA domain-containing protein [Acidobacteriota bacterium]
MNNVDTFLPRDLSTILPARTAIALGALLLLLGMPAVAQDDDRTFEETTSVVEVQVPVNVTDRNGDPVRGLTAADFVLKDGGDKREITEFEVIDLDVLEPQEAEAKLETLPSVARRHFLLLFDFSFSQPSSILKAREAAKQFVLERLHPTDLVAVATFSLETGPNLVITFTPDRGQLAHALDTLGFSLEYGNKGTTDPLRFMIQSPDSLRLTSPTTSNQGDIKQAAETAALESWRVIGAQMQRGERAYERSRITAWSRSMGDMAKSLDAVKGRKHLVYFSEGFDSRLLLGNAPSTDSFDDQRNLLDRAQGTLWMVDSDETYGNTPLQNDIERMLESFRRADCIVQAVDIGGLRADITGGDASGTLATAGTDGLFMMAEGTGGALFEDANDFGTHLDRVLERSTVTYVLTFRTDEITFDGKYHRLRVDLADRPERGTQISHRSGYYAPRPFRELDPLERSLLASDAIATAAERDEVGIDVLAAPFRADADTAYVPVIVEVDGNDLLTDHPSDILNLEIYAYVTDDTGAMRDFFTQSIGLNIATARGTIESGGIKYYGHLRLQPGEHLVRVLARNTDSGRTGVAAVDLNVPEWNEDDPVLLKPFFMESPGSWVLVREPLEGETVVYPFVVNGEPFVPSARPQLGNEETATLCLVAYNLGEESPAVQSWVADAEGTTVGGAELALRERTITGIRGLDKLVADFTPEGLDAGHYTLNVALTDPVSGSEETTAIPFVVTGDDQPLAVPAGGGW